MRGALQKRTKGAEKLLALQGRTRLADWKSAIRQIWKSALQLCALVAAVAAIAHDSPEHEIEGLNQKIAANGPTAELLARRATEWRALGKYDEASRDLERALVINSNSIPLLLEYASVELERGNVCNAETTVRYGLNRAAESQKGALHMMLSEIAESRGLYDFALQDCEKAMASGEPQLEWHLTRARLMCRLGKHAESASALKTAYERTPNVVLEIEWIEAMIDAGQCEKALERTVNYSGRGRWRSAWLIRQARAELGLKRAEAAEKNLLTALEELDQRINPAKLDAMLIADRAVARWLRGERDAAAQDMDRIRGALKMQVPGSTLVRLERMFSDERKPSP